MSCSVGWHDVLMVWRAMACNIRVKFGLCWVWIVLQHRPDPRTVTYCVYCGWVNCFLCFHSWKASLEHGEIYKGHFRQVLLVVSLSVQCPTARWSPPITCIAKQTHMACFEVRHLTWRPCECWWRRQLLTSRCAWGVRPLRRESPSPSPDW